MKHPLRDWRKLGECQVIQHSPGGSWYVDVKVNSEGLLALIDNTNKCVHLLTKKGTLVRSIGKGVHGGLLYGVAFDPKGDVWMTDWLNNKLVKLSQDGQILQTIHHASGDSDRFIRPLAVSVSPDGLICICDSGNRRVTVHDEEGTYLYSFGFEGPQQLAWPYDMAFGSDGLAYVTDIGNNTVSVWSKEGTFKRVLSPSMPQLTLLLLVTTIC